MSVLCLLLFCRMFWSLVSLPFWLPEIVVYVSGVSQAVSNPSPVGLTDGLKTSWSLLGNPLWWDHRDLLQNLVTKTWKKLYCIYKNKRSIGGLCLPSRERYLWKYLKSQTKSSGVECLFEHPIKIKMEVDWVYMQTSTMITIHAHMFWSANESELGIFQWHVWVRGTQTSDLNSLN